ncbi:hypothetical protein [Streptomyces flavovirens]
MIRNALRMRWSLPLALALLVVASFTPMLIAAGSKASASTPVLSGAEADRAALPKLTSFNKVSLGDGTVETLYAADSANAPWRWRYESTRRP